MIRRLYGLRQYQHALRQFTWFHVDIQKLALASAVTALILTVGTTLLTDTGPAPSQQKPQTVNPSANNTASHPLLGIDTHATSIPGLQESPASQQEPTQNAQSLAADPIVNGVMHQTTVTINGESIEIPPAGTSHQTLKNQDGSQTDVDIQHEQAQIDGTFRSNIIIDSRSRSSNSSTSLNSRITITH